MELNKVWCMDNIQGMIEKVDDNSIDLTVTSPPYDELRDYNGYSWDFEGVANQLFRVTKEGGVIVWVVGDAVIRGSESLTSFKQALYFKEVGFNVHDTMIYEKNGSSFPASKNGNRYTQIFEYMFVFSKGKPKTSNLIIDKPNRWAGYSNFGKPSHYLKNGTKIIHNKKNKPTPDFSARNNIWKYNNGKGYSSKDKVEHPAIFPEKLVEDHILSWSNPDDIILDPFFGSGTTGKIAKKLGRKYIGFEISQKYCDIAEERISKL